MAEDRPLDGETAIVTGSTGEGMGRQTALTLAKAGANVALNYGTYRTDETQAQAVADEVRAHGVDGISVQADTRTQEGVERLVTETEKALGVVDIAVGNAGGDFLERDILDVDLEEWRKVVQAELDGAYLLARAVLPGMRKRKAGRIVFIGWEGAERAYRPPLDYAVGKAARHDLAWKLARSEEANGITVNTVAPGYIPYPTESESQELLAQGDAWTRRKRSTTQDVAEAVLWLCRHEARFVTGSFVRVYGPY